MNEVLIDECLENESRLTAWESEFLESIQDQISRGYDLSLRQEEILQEIHDKVTNPRQFG